jgi:dTDP-4-amino-4,6-dideoxygalactose transaminase
MRTSFNKPYLTGKELEYISEAHASLHLYGDGQVTKKCQTWLEKRVGCQKSLLCVGVKV